VFKPCDFKQLETAKINNKYINPKDKKRPAIKAGLLIEHEWSF